MNKNPKQSEFLFNKYVQDESLVKSLNCHALTDKIVDKVVKKTIKQFNKKITASTFGDEYPALFTSFDCYCIFWYKDWGSWELREQIRDCIESFLELEYDNLSGPEKFVLDCEYSTKEDVSTRAQIIEELYDSFMAEVEAHLELKKIQQFLDKI